VHELGDLAPRDAGGRDQLVEPLQARRGRIGIRGQTLAGEQLTGRRLQREVGEGPTDIESDAIGQG
jgi:hypothetical protein